MPVYEIPEYPEKRLRYFHGQFLQDQDFIDEQNYHVDRQRRHNRLLHSAGIAAGLTVTVDQGNDQVIVNPGTAIDALGRQIVLAAATAVPLADHNGQTVTIMISYRQSPSDPSTFTGGEGDTRWHELPLIEVVPEGQVPQGANPIALTRLVIDGAGTIQPPNNVVRHYAGLRLPGESPPTLHSGAANQVNVEGSLQVSGTVNGRNIAGDGALLDSHVADNMNPHRVTAAQVDALNSIDGVSNAGGNVDLMPSNAITISPSNAANRITIGENHSSLTSNPHNVTAAQTGALVSIEGVSNPGGNIDLMASNAITISPSDATNRITIGENHSSLTSNPHNVTALQVGALSTSGGTVTGTLNVRSTNIVATMGSTTSAAQNSFGMDPDKNVSVWITGQSPGSLGTGFRAALYIWPIASGVEGIRVTSASGVDTMNVGGIARFTGTKIGYVSDTFVNGSGTVLHTGDVVKLKSNGVIRFEGDNNRIPIPEVTLADSLDDPLVIGIVDQEATPAPDEPDNRTELDDPTSIAPGGNLFVVTLGTYAHCKVDATREPIEVGDLLTSSNNPGFAQSARHPGGRNNIGTIIGKALESLKEGTGYIAVFVNIQ